MREIEIKTIEDALEFIQKNSVRNITFKEMPPIDWDSWRERIESFKQGPTLRDEMDIIRFALRELKDNHSYLYTPNAPSEDVNILDQAEPLPTGRMIGKNAYIRMTPCILRKIDYTKATQSLIQKLDSERPDGWIVDLRINTGGDFGPMLAGIGPLIGNGIHGYLSGPSKDEKIMCIYEDGKAITKTHPDDHKPAIRGYVSTPYTLQKEKPLIAVLTGESTCSSGEFTLMNFMKRPNVKIFGEATGGLSSSNGGIPFKDKIIVLTMGLMLDREGIPYGDKIEPDIHFSRGATPSEIELETYNPAKDLLVAQAADWIHKATTPQPQFAPPIPSPF